jgi:hypothetical protein
MDAITKLVNDSIAQVINEGEKLDKAKDAIKNVVSRNNEIRKDVMSGKVGEKLYDKMHPTENSSTKVVGALAKKLRDQQNMGVKEHLQAAGKKAVEATKGKAGEVASDIKEKASEAVSKAGAAADEVVSKAGEAVSKAGTAAGEAIGKAGAAAGEAAGEVKEKAASLGSKALKALEGNPKIAAAAAAALAAGAGAIALRKKLAKNKKK